MLTNEQAADIFDRIKRVSSADEIEAETESLCQEFENQKPYLLERWKAKS